jgi:hypothetical protein
MGVEGEEMGVEGEEMGVDRDDISQSCTTLNQKRQPSLPYKLSRHGEKHTHTHTHIHTHTLNQPHTRTSHTEIDRGSWIP